MPALTPVVEILLDVVDHPPPKLLREVAHVVHGVGHLERFHARQVRARERAGAEALGEGLAPYLGLRYPVQQATVTRDAYCASHWNT